MYSFTIILCLCFCIFSESLGELVVSSHLPPDPRKESNPVSQHLRGMEYTAADLKFRSSSPSPICDCSSQESEHPYPYIVGSQVTGRRPPCHDAPQENRYRPPHISCPKETGYRPSPSTNCPTHECPARRTISPRPPCTVSQTTLPPCKQSQTLPPCTKCQTLPPCTTFRPLKYRLLKCLTTRRRRRRNKKTKT